MRRIQTLIVDDEPIARKILREHLENCADIEIIGEAENGREALEKITESQPDLVLLDLEMPNLDGFAVIRTISVSPPPAIVIVTAYPEHGIRAFEAGALDYLLKPVSPERLAKALERVRALTYSASTGTRPRKIVGRNGNEYVLLEPDEVLAFQAQGPVVWILTSSMRLVSAETLRALEERLDSSRFQRVHRNAIVNVNHVRKLTQLGGSRYMITLSNNMELIASKRQTHSIRQILRW